MEQLLDELDGLIQKGIHVPGSGKVLIDAIAIQDLMAQMREQVANAAQYNQRISVERDRILSDARTQARRIVEEAEAQATSRVDDQMLVHMARQRAKEIQADAEQRATSLRAETDSYVANQLNGLENRIVRLLREVQAGQRALAQEHPRRSETA